MAEARHTREALAVAAGALAFGVLFGHPVVRHFGAFEVAQDWDQHFVYHWVPWQTVVQYRQVPHWNPYMCGGTPLLANPQTRFVTPLFLLHLLAGPIAGLHLEIILHLALAAAGGWVLARVVGLSGLAAVAVAIVFPACSAHYLHVGVGHTWFMGYAYVPWVAAGVWHGIETRRLLPAALAGLVLALQIGEGGIYPAPHAAMLIVVVAVAVAVGRRDLWPLAALATTALFGFGLSAPRLLPTLAFMADFPRLIESPEVVSLRTLTHALFWRGDGEPELPDLDWKFHEYGTYLGPAAALLALVGLALAWRRAWPWALAGALFLALAFGDHGPLSPWALLHRLPLFASHHVPSRFLTPFMVVAALLAGHGVDALARRWGRAGVALGAALVLIATVDAFLVGPRHLQVMFEFGPAPSGRLSFTRPLPPAPEFRQTFMRSGRSMFMTVRANKGVLDCYDPIKLGIGAAGFGAEDYRGEQYLTGAGTVALARWSPNELAYDVDLPAPADLIVNQNFYRPWTLVAGRGRVGSADGLLAVRLPAGRQRVVLRYVSWPFRVGLALGIATLAALLGLAWRRR